MVDDRIYWDFRKIFANAIRAVGLAKHIDGDTGTTGLYFLPYGVPIIFAEFTFPSWSELQTRIEQKVVA